MVKSLLQKDSLDQCSLNELQQFADRHPYFGAAQLLLTKKMQEERSPRFDDQLQKTYLFFHNPLWVQHLLNDTGTGEIKPAEKKPEVLAVTADLAEQAPVIVSEPAVPVLPEVTEIPAAAPEIAQAVEIQQAPVTEAALESAEAPSAEIQAEVPATAEAEQPVLENPALKATDPGDTGFLFEPYHTVDYFASQGIKYQEEAKPKDKFGQQLKSFTEWLKTMRKLPVAEMNLPADQAADTRVEQLAERSLQEGDVVTEAMADVWEKQGNIAKAIDIYSKLSLLEPSKSPYFAAKIEELKKLN